MPQTGPLADPTTNHLRLESWRQTATGGSWSLRSRLIGAALVAVVIVVFFLVAWRPLRTPALTVVSIGPAISQKSDEPSKAHLQTVAAASLDRFRDVATKFPAARIETQSSLGTALTDARRSWLGLRSQPGQHTLIHAVGIAAADKHRALLVSEHSPLTGRWRSLDVCRLLQAVGESDSPAVVVIHLLETKQVPIGHLPEITAWRFEQAIDRTLRQLQQSQLAVVLNRFTVGDEAESDTVAKISQRLIDGFGEQADTNQDKIISAGELIRWTTTTGKDDRGPAPKLLSTTATSHWQRVALTPVVNAETPESPEPEEPGDLVTAGSSESPSESPGDQRKPAEYQVTAPTLAAALALAEAGIETRRCSDAKKIEQQLLDLLNAESLEESAIDWLATPMVASTSWDEVNWTRVVLDSNVDWSAKQDLIRCRVLANRLAAQPITRRWFPKRWESVQWTRLDAERSLTSPVRSNHSQHVRVRVEEAIRQYTKLQKEADAILQAKRLCDQIRRQTSRLVASPVRSRSSSDDVASKLFQDTLALSHWLRKGNAESIHECESLVDSIVDRSAAAHSALQMKSEWLDPDPASMQSAQFGPTDRCVNVTRIRITRSALAVELQSDDGDAEAVKNLRAAAQLASNVLINSSSGDNIGTAIAAFQQATRAVAQPGVERLAEDSGQPSWPTKMLREIAADTTRFCSDATADERKRLAQIADRCRRLSMSLGETIIDHPAQDFQIDVVAHGSLAEAETASLEIVVRKLSDTTIAGRLEIELDPKNVTIDSNHTPQPFDVRRVSDQAYRELATPQLPAGPQRLSAEKQTQLHVDLRRTADNTFEQTAVNVRWITPRGIYRASVPLEMPLPPIARVELAGPDGAAEESWTMHPNRTEFRNLLLEPLDRATQNVQVRLLAWSTTSVSPPPAMSKTRADRWYSQQPPPTVLASHPKLAVRFDNVAQVLFKPQKVDPKKPPTPVRWLFCEVTDLDRQIVQWIDLSPTVFRPSALVAPQIAFDHAAQVTTVTLRDPAAQIGGPRHSDQSTRAEVELRDNASRIVARGDIHLPPGEQKTKKFSSADASTGPVTLRIHVDGWPSAFVYRIPTDRSSSDIQPVDNHASVSILQPAKEIVAKNGQSPISAQVGVDVTDHIFRYGKDTVTLGLDLNGDRYLQDEPAVTMTTPVAIGFTWNGIGEQGEIGLSSRVAPHHMPVPVGWIRDRRSQLIARLQRGNAVTWSRPLAVVFDGSPPETQDVQIVSPLPAVLGTAVAARVKINDAGLSGAASLAAGWATAGQLEFTPDVKQIVGQRLEDGWWMVQVPTDGLVPGKHPLLLRPTDAAGNPGKVHAVSVAVQTAGQLAALRRQESTAVRGSVAYVKLPAAGMKVALVPQAEEEDEAKEAKEDKPQPPPLEALTDSKGHFVFPKVTAGDYELQVEGLFRGMRHRKRVRIAVTPPEPSTVPTIRID